jgi:hypothetical protein
MVIKNKKQNQSYGSLAPAVPFLFSDNPDIPDIPDATFVCVLVVAADNTRCTAKPSTPDPNPVGLALKTTAPAELLA